MRGIGEQQHDAERGEREEEHDRRRRRDRRTEQRQRHLAERARPRCAEHPRRVGAVRIEVRPEAADRAHDHRDVEEHLGDQHRRDAALPARETRARRRAGTARGTRSRPRRSAGRTARSRTRGTAGAPGTRSGATTYAAGSPTASVSAVATTACQSVNHATCRSPASASTSCERAGRQRPADDRRDRPYEEHAEEAERDHGAHRAPRGDRRVIAAPASPQHDPRPLVDPLVAVRSDRRRAHA